MFFDLVTGGTFVLIALVAFLAGDALFGARRRKATLEDVPQIVGGGDAPLGAPRRKLGTITRFLAAIVPQRQVEIESIEHDLRRGGFYDPFALKSYLANRNAIVLFVIIVTALLAYEARIQERVQQMVLILGGVVTVLCYGLPRVFLYLQASTRVRRIQYGLPDALDIVTMCLTGGLPLQEALGRVTTDLRYSHPDIAVELEIVRKQSDANTLAQALRQFANRIDVPDTKSMAALVSQTERLGTNVAIAIRDFADSLRRGHRHRAEERASKTSVKMLFPVILCLAPPVYILLCGPAVLQMREFLVKENNPGGILSPDLNSATARTGLTARQVEANARRRAGQGNRANAATRGARAVGTPGAAVTPTAGP